jgi:hypothetical protein
MSRGRSPRRSTLTSPEGRASPSSLGLKIAEVPTIGPMPVHVAQHIIDQLERQVLGQLAQMARIEDAAGNSDRMTDGGRGRLSTQRDLW